MLFVDSAKLLHVDLEVTFNTKEMLWPKTNGNDINKKEDVGKEIFFFFLGSSLSRRDSKKTRYSDQPWRFNEVIQWEHITAMNHDCTVSVISEATKQGPE